MGDEGVDREGQGGWTGRARGGPVWGMLVCRHPHRGHACVGGGAEDGRGGTGGGRRVTARGRGRAPSRVGGAVSPRGRGGRPAAQTPRQRAWSGGNARPPPPAPRRTQWWFKSGTCSVIPRLHAYPLQAGGGAAAPPPASLTPLAHCPACHQGGGLNKRKIRPPHAAPPAHHPPPLSAGRGR